MNGYSGEVIDLTGEVIDLTGEVVDLTSEVEPSVIVDQKRKRDNQTKMQKEKELESLLQQTKIPAGKMKGQTLKCLIKPDNRDYMFWSLDAWRKSYPEFIQLLERALDLRADLQSNTKQMKITQFMLN